MGDQIDHMRNSREGPHGWAPPIAAKAGVKPGVTDPPLAEELDGPTTSKEHWNLGVMVCWECTTTTFDSGWARFFFTPTAC